MASALDIARIEVSAFFSAIARVKVFRPTKYNRFDAAYCVYEDLADGEAGQKKLAVHEAVKTVVGKGFALPADTRFYITNTYEAQNRAFSTSIRRATRSVGSPWAWAPPRAAAVTASRRS
jgi:hypothetical protein